MESNEFASMKFQKDNKLRLTQDDSCLPTQAEMNNITNIGSPIMNTTGGWIMTGALNTADVSPGRELANFLTNPNSTFDQLSQ